MVANKITPGQYQPSSTGASVSFSLPRLYQQSQFDVTRISSHLTATRSQCYNSNDLHTSIHHRDNSVLLVIGQEGKTFFQMDGEDDELLLRGGEAYLFMPKGRTLKRRQPGKEKASSFVVALTLDPEQELFADLSHELSDIAGGFHKVRQEFLPNMTERQALLASSDRATLRLMQEGRCLETFGRIFEALREQQTAGLSGDRLIFRKAQAMLLDQLDAPPSLAVIAAECGVNHVKLNQIFAKETGLTVFSYYRQTRLELAANALAQSSKSITEIALQHGFSSSSHFASTFTAHFGQSPRQYRQRVKS